MLTLSDLLSPMGQFLISFYFHIAENTSLFKRILACSNSFQTVATYTSNFSQITIK